MTHPPRYLTMDQLGCLHEVTNLLDRHERPTLDPAIADHCIVKIHDHFHAMLVADVPIYTVH